MQEQLARARGSREAAGQAIKEARERLAQERGALETAECAAREAERAAQDVREQLARTGAEQSGKEARELREGLAAAERATAAMRYELTAERTAREAADRATHQMREQLERETSSKEEAERIKQARKTASEEHASIEAAEPAAMEATAPKRSGISPVAPGAQSKQACSSGVHLRRTDLHPSVAAATPPPDFGDPSPPINTAIQWGRPRECYVRGSRCYSYRLSDGSNEHRSESGSVG